MSAASPGNSSTAVHVVPSYDIATAVVGGQSLVHTIHNRRRPDASATPSRCHGRSSGVVAVGAGVGAIGLQVSPSSECRRSRPVSDSPSHQDTAASQPPVGTGHAAMNSAPWS